MEKRVLITAGASGIGRAMGEAFAAKGAQIWVTDINDEALAQVPKKWRRSPVNAADEAQMAALFGQVARDWGGVDVLVCNAATNPVYGPQADVSDEAFSNGKRTDGNEFILAGDKWTFNLWTKLYNAPGSYTVTMESGDTGEYVIDPICKGFAVTPRGMHSPHLVLLQIVK